MIKAARGGYVGGQPGYGRRAESAELVEHNDEAKVVEMVVAMREGGASYRTICSALTAAGLEPCRAIDWHPMVVRSIVQGARRRAQPQRGS